MSNVVICSLLSNQTTAAVKGQPPQIRFHSCGPEQQQWLVDIKRGSINSDFGWISTENQLPSHVSCHAMQEKFQPYVTTALIFANHQHYQIIGVFLWDTRLSPKYKFLHFNASQWESSWGTDLPEQDFDIVCKKFMTVCLTQCPVPEVIYLLQTFTFLWPCLKFHRVTSAAVWVKEVFPLAFDGKINSEELPLQ